MAIELPKVVPDGVDKAVVAIMSIIGAVFAMFLPETSGLNLPETFEDLENITLKKLHFQTNSRV